MQNVGHYLGARSCFLLNNPFKLLFFPIAWVVSLPFEKNKPKNSLIFNLKALSKHPYYTSHFKVFFLCYFQIWPHTFEERLSVNSCYSELLSKRKRGGEKKSVSDQPTPVVTLTSFSSRKEKKFSSYKF